MDENRDPQEAVSGAPTVSPEDTDLPWVETNPKPLGALPLRRVLSLLHGGHQTRPYH